MNFVKSNKHILKRFLVILPIFIVYIMTYNFMGNCSLNENYNFLTELDEIIPFVPEMVWLYISMYFVMMFSGFFIKDDLDFYRLVISIILTVLITYPFFYFFPAVYPRAEFVVSDLSTKILRWNYANDVINNTFPSLHVSLSFTLALTMGYLNKKKKNIWILWAILIAASTVLVKKHFLIDPLGGFIVAYIAFASSVKYKYFDKIIIVVLNLFPLFYRKKSDETNVVRI